MSEVKNVFVQVVEKTERKVIIKRGKAATEYEVITGEHHRMEIICQKCGRVAEIQDKAIARLIKERKYSNFTLQHYSLFVYGECKICRRHKS